MLTLLPLAIYTGSGAGASAAMGAFRALRGSLSVTSFSGPTAAQFTLETSADGSAWRTVGAWDAVTEKGESARVFAGLLSFVRVAYAVGAGTVGASIEAEAVQVYATVGDFNASGLQASALEGVSQQMILAALEGASRLVDDYLSARTTLPLVVFASASLRRAVVVIAVYDLLSTIGYNPEGDNTNYRDRYLDIIKWLTAIRDSGAPLPSGIIDSSPAINEGSPDVESDLLRGW